MCSVASGVPQGSVLGPLLFLIYINDLPSQVTSTIHLFADDCVIFREITADCDTNRLQSDLDIISNWCSLWLMELNVNKCKAMHVSRTSNVSQVYYLNNLPLEQVTSYKYLGIHITYNLTWATHINNIVNNANRALGYLRRNFFKAPHSLKLLLYKTLIRPKLEYATSVWDPNNLNLINALELVQNNAARFILSNYNRTASVTAMKTNLSLPSLAARRKVSRLSLFHKIFHHTTLHDVFIHIPHYVSRRIDHSYKVHVPSCSTNTFSQSFVPRTSLEWNHLPANIVSISDNSLFRDALTNITC